MTDEREAALGSLLAQNPHALVAAIDADGLFVPLPETFDRGDHGVVRARSALELVDPANRGEIIEAWHRAKESGGALATTELYDGSSMTIYFFDVRPVHGVFVGVFLVDAELDLVSALETREPIPPRTGRVHKDEVAIIREVDDDLVQILGWDRSELEGMRALDLVHPDDQERAIDSWMEMLGSPGGVARWRGRHLRHDGTYLWMELTNHNHLRDEIGAVVCDMADISDEMDALETLREREQLLARLTEALPLGVAHVDPDGVILYANERLHELVGHERATTLDEQLAGLVPDDRPAYDAAVHAALALGNDSDLEVRIRVPNKPRLHLCAMTIRALFGATGEPAGALVCVDDVTESSEMRAEMERRATTDELTGCLNRSAVIDALDRTLAVRASGSLGTAVVFLDLDGFKEINDSHGHHAGDQVLIDAAARLQGAMRDGDVVGRLGGDEFLVVLPEVGSSDKALMIGQRIAEAVARPVVAGGKILHVRASVGVAWTSSPATEGEELIAAADRAMYESKRAGVGAPVAHFV